MKGQELLKAEVLADLQDYIGSGKQVEPKLSHSFADGMYIRTLYIDKGTLVVGKRHRYKTVNILLKGTVTIYDGKESRTLSAPFMSESAEFTKKCAFAHEDSVWVNMHVTELKDLDAIEEHFIIPENEYIEYLKKEELE